jgi:D-glycero-D-manno-heptose 1,7-bisphosphate phosphatase
VAQIENAVEPRETKHVVLDRDGTLIRYIPYLHDPARVEVLPTVADGLTRLVQAGCKLFLHTNQSGVGRGYFSMADALACNVEMLKQIGLGDDLFEEICVCPETPEQEIAYRKPSPRFGAEIVAKHAADKSRLWYVGDNVTDLLTAKNIGCRGVGVSTGVHDLRGELETHDLTNMFPVFGSFDEAAAFIAGHEADR